MNKEHAHIFIRNKLFMICCHLHVSQSAFVHCWCFQSVVWWGKAGGPCTSVVRFRRTMVLFDC